MKRADEKKVAIIGGGQLGRMLCEASKGLGIQTGVLDPSGELSSAGMVADRAFKGKISEKEDIVAFVKEFAPDVVTIEIEHVNADAMSELESTLSVPFHPSPSTIKLIQDKYLQKEHLAKHSIPLPDFRKASGKEEIVQIGKDFGYPLMLKSRKMAYDGRGNAVVKSEADIEEALKSLVSQDVYAEKWVPFEKELAVIVARGANGETVVYDTVETIQKNSMCDTVIAPAQIPSSSQKEAQRISSQAISTLQGRGIFAVEVFLLKDGSVLLNEIAPRVHNSGHFSIEACVTSQFEQHLRAVLGLPLGSPAMKVDSAVMVNVIGDGAIESTYAPCVQALKVPGASVHWYCKGEPKKARKMGHITVVGSSFLEVKKRVGELGIMDGKEKDVLGKVPPLVGIIMGSDSDLPIMKVAAEILRDFEVPFELTIVSAHRTPDRMFEYAREADKRGLKVIIAGAGGAAHLPGMVASLTPLPVIGVPIGQKRLDGLDSLHSIVQMPRGVPVATVAIDNSTNAALLAVRILGCWHGNTGGGYLARMAAYQEDMRRQVQAKVASLEEQGWDHYHVKGH